MPCKNNSKFKSSFTKCSQHSCNNPIYSLLIHFNCGHLVMSKFNGGGVGGAGLSSWYAGDISVNVYCMVLIS